MFVIAFFLALNIMDRRRDYYYDQLLKIARDVYQEIYIKILSLVVFPVIGFLIGITFIPAVLMYTISRIIVSVYGYFKSEKVVSLDEEEAYESYLEIKV